MAHPRLIQWLAVLLCGGLIYGAAQLVPALQQGRQALNMYGNADVLASTPPEYAFAIQAFGAFRSLIVNLAFIRAETYKDEGRYYDAMQLASWICKLQPRFPSVWEFQAWNMAWNISVTTFTPEERWNWVYNGVKLLRDEGIPYNPRAVNLYKQLAWTFNNKMGENLDDFHLDYKRNWAWRMHLLLGPRPLALGEFRPGEEFRPVLFDVADDPLLEMARTTELQNEARRRQLHELGSPLRTTKTAEERLAEAQRAAPAAGELTPAEVGRRAAYDHIRAIADAPATLAGLYAEYPETREMVGKLRELGVLISDDPLDEEHYWYDGKLAATFFARYRALLDTPTLRAEPAEAALTRLDELVGAREGRPAGLALVRFLQRKVLREVYKLEPERMAELVRIFGPLDWRAVDAHSLYWVAQGLIQGGETVNSFMNDKTNTARILFFSLRNLFLRNRVTFEPDPGNIFRSYINFAPDPDFVEPMHRAFITYGPMIDPDPGDASGAGSVFRTGHINFLSEAIRMLFFADRVAEAEHYYEYLRTHYAQRPDGSMEARYALTLRDFVIEAFYGNIDGPRETELAVADLLLRAYEDLANDDAAGYQRYAAKALDFHEAYMQERRDATGPRMKLRPFQDYQIDVFRAWLTLPATDLSALIRKARLWRVAPPRLKQWVYDSLSEWFGRECAAWGLDAARAFAEPPGMVAFREEHPRREVERREPTAETPVQPANPTP